MAVVLFAACEPTTETKVSKEDIVSTLKVNAENLQDAILKQDLVEFNKYVDQNIPFTIGQSNLEQEIIISSFGIFQSIFKSWSFHKMPVS